METLPELDQEPEVFETSDNESVENIHFKPEEISGPDIEFRGLDRKAAHSLFEENILEGIVDLVDFSGSLVAEKQGRNSYNSRKFTETKTQRLARIAQELAEIEGEDEFEKTEVLKLRKTLETSMKNGGRSGYYFEKFEESFRQVEEQLAVVNLENVSLNQTDITKGTHTDAEHLSRKQILEVEQRLHRLETAIGATELPQDTNVQLHLRDLDRKVNVLYNPEYEIDTLKAKVVELNRELEALTKSRRMAQLALPETSRVAHPPEPSASKFEKKVDTIYSKLGEIDTAKARLPMVIDRLKTLHQTHYDIASAVSTVGELDNTLSSIEQDLLKWNETLDSVKTAMDKHAMIFEQSKTETEEKMNALESRVDALLEETSGC